MSEGWDEIEGRPVYRKVHEAEAILAMKINSITASVGYTDGTAAGMVAFETYEEDGSTSPPMSFILSVEDVRMLRHMLSEMLVDLSEMEDQPS